MSHSWNRGRSKFMILAGTVFTIVALGLFFSFHGRQLSKSISQENHHVGPVASVVTSPLQRRDLRRTLQAYGTVSPLPEATQVLALPYQCRVLGLMVTPGQFVRKGDPLIKIAPGPAARLRLKQSKSRATSLKKALAMLMKRVRLKLSTQQELITMESRVNGAEQELENLRKQEIGTRSLIRSEGNGIVSSLDVSAGEIVPAGGSLLQILRQKRMVVVFGVEIEDRSLLKIGQTVRIHMAQDTRSQTVTGKIRTISHAVDTATRLIMVTAIPDHPADLFLNAFVEVSFDILHHFVLVVPVHAILPTKNGFYLFTVVNHHAVCHDVQVVMKTASFAEVTGDGLREGDQVVALGNYELHEGMAVKEETRP